MESKLINTRSDLDAIAGTLEHKAFMALLVSTLWCVEKDDAAKTYRVIEDISTAAGFGFTAADFPDAMPPELPVYELVVVPVPTVITMRQARLALLNAGLLDAVNAGIRGMLQAVQIEWEFAATVDRASPLVATLAAALRLDDAALDDLFTHGSVL